MSAACRHADLEGVESELRDLPPRIGVGTIRNEALAKILEVRLGLREFRINCVGRSVAILKDRLGKGTQMAFLKLDCGASSFSRQADAVLLFPPVLATLPRPE